MEQQHSSAGRPASSSVCSAACVQLRKELRAASAELRKAALLSATNNPLDLGLSKDSPGIRCAWAACAWGSCSARCGPWGVRPAQSHVDGMVWMVGLSLACSPAPAAPPARRGTAVASVHGGSDGASMVSDLDVPGGFLGRTSTHSRTSKSTASIQQVLMRCVTSSWLPCFATRQGCSMSLGLLLRLRLLPGLHWAVHMLSSPLRRPRATFDGTSLSMPLNEAWSALLEHWLPALLEELEAAAAFLLLTVEGAWEAMPGHPCTPVAAGAGSCQKDPVQQAEHGHAAAYRRHPRGLPGAPAWATASDC